MTGYELALEDFANLLRVVSRHYRQQIAGMLSLTAHTRKGEVSFRSADGAEVPLADVHWASQVDAQVQRQVYSLFTHYAHFG
jgi:hypothetical protein